MNMGYHFATNGSDTSLSYKLAVSDMTNEDDNNYASPPCFAHELGDSDYFGIDPTDKNAVAGWQKALRKTLLKKRMAVQHELPQLATEITSELTRLIDPHPGLIVSLYWPLRGELDFRDWMHALVAQQVRVALPVVTQKAHPMIFREWAPDARMEPGIWNIPVPADSEVTTPEVVIVPLVAFDAGCYRLGYGGGYYDRTLANMSSTPTVIGVGPPLCEVPTIYPQPHDIPMDIIVSGANRVKYREEKFKTIR